MDQMTSGNETGLTLLLDFLLLVPAFEQFSPERILPRIDDLEQIVKRSDVSKSARFAREEDGGDVLDDEILEVRQFGEEFVREVVSLFRSLLFGFHDFRQVGESDSFFVLCRF
jgi:hypothetical protein